jgi:type II secretory pathway pseudopilin PulG
MHDPSSPSDRNAADPRLTENHQMSNVLIGIIGVILFIGLALAGALFLGPRFQESTNNSRASAAVQAVSQVANAANMYRVQEGRTDYTLDATAVPATDLVSNNYLKSIPGNPTGGTAPSLATTGYVTMTLATNDAAVCAAINKQSGITTNIIAPAGTQGCYSGGTTTAPAAPYVAFAAI